ncbi:MAG: diadenylate cyclase, partial [Syntrophales bacterium]|nr:diadenylate cyclase [Syntrophales bacterium]
MIPGTAHLVSSIRIQDILDILIITIMISALLIWFKQRASRFVLMGISVLGIIYAAARFFQLYLTTAVLQGFFAILLFVLVVIFQEDLRRFFERLALLSRIGSGAAASPQSHTPEVIAAAVGNMARHRVGALIVIKGRDPLERHLSGGIPLNGLVSQPLLESIFDPHSAGHDGAVIIAGDRVVSFGCHLPLATGTESRGSMGLRHTAALGLAERSDALCIVVSEEKGTIAVAKDETIETVGSPAALLAIIETHLAAAAPAAPAGWANTWLKKNTREKVIALVLACVLWLMFGYQREILHREFTVPIEYVNVSRPLVIDEPKSAEAKIVLRGPPQAFQLLTPENLKISLNLSQLREGTQEVVLTKDMLRLPSNIYVESITPCL